MRGAEFQGFARRGGVGDQIGRIASVSWFFQVGYGAAGFGLDGAEDLTD